MKKRFLKGYLICFLVIMISSIQALAYYYTPKSFIYGYANNLLIAEADNAINGEIAYSSFEDNTFGNWTFVATGIQSQAGLKSITGTKYYSLTAGNITKSFSPAPGKNIIVSYWSRSGVQTVNGSALGIAGRSVSIDGFAWTYYEQLLANPASVTISGTGLIDELRLYPEEAYMTTYTYDPVIGITSKCDANNHIIYSEYDIYNRLSVVRDQDYNILKKYCYGAAGIQEDCAVQMFYSVLKSGVYTRNDCGSGYAGSNLTYTVPAGTYTSTVSQAIADQMAQTDVTNYGQTYANINGACSLLYYNVVKSGSFTRNNCASGYQGSTVTYTVAANTYSSIISQSDADQLAQNDVNANGQNYANTNGTCIAINVSITALNTTGLPRFTATYTNTTTGQVYSFSIPPAGSTIIGSIPVGTYNLVMQKTGINTTSYIYTCGALTRTGVTGTFNAITVNSTTNNTIEVDTVI